MGIEPILFRNYIRFILHSMPKMTELNGNITFRDILIDDDVIARIYTPNEINEPSSALIYFHGGAFIIGSIGLSVLFSII